MEDNIHTLLLRLQMNDFPSLIHRLPKCQKPTSSSVYHFYTLESTHQKYKA